jgi:membrane protein DedA with SNARE-associated domain
MAGVAGVRPLHFVLAIAVARGLRYLLVGLLAIWYGDLALELMRTRGREIALWVVGLIVGGIAVWWFIRRRRIS